MRTRSDRGVLAVTMLLAVMVTAEKCDQQKVVKEIRKWNVKVGKALVAVNEGWDDFYKDAVAEVTQEIIDEHADDPNFTDEMAEELFKEQTATLNEKNEVVEDVVKTVALTQEALEQSLDAADHIEGHAIAKTMRDILNGFGSLLDIFNHYAKDAENEKLNAAINWIGVVQNGALQIFDMLGVEHDEDDPKDD